MQTTSKNIIMSGYCVLAIINLICTICYLNIYSIMFVGFTLYFFLILTYMKNIITTPIIIIEDDPYFIYQHYLNLTSPFNNNLRKCIYLFSLLLFIGSYAFAKIIPFTGPESVLCMFDLFIFGFASLIPVYDDILISVIRCKNIIINDIHQDQNTTTYGSTS